MSGWGGLAVDLIIILILIGGIAQFRTPAGARRGNLTAALALVLALAIVVWRHRLLDPWILVPMLLVGAGVGLLIAQRVNMIQIPALVAFQHGAGGVAAFLVSFVELTRAADELSAVALVSGLLGLVIGAATFSGSMIASGKLANRMKQTPTVLPHHSLVLGLAAVLVVVVAVVAGLATGAALTAWLIVLVVLAVALGVVFSIRIGGADMPVLISFLNATAGLAAAFCGVIIANRLLVACGATVAASGSILTYVMCTSMNRSLFSVFTGIQHKSATAACSTDLVAATSEACELPAAPPSSQDPLTQAAEIARDAQSVIIVPGYGMALAHAASEAVGLGRTLEKLGKDVRYAVHPVAGRMPGHMHVLLAEAEVDYDKLYEMKDINPRFPETDLVLIVGACDVVNPAAVEKEGTPISGMPILRADQARHVVVLNLDEKPGYSGVPNTLYDQPQTILLFGDAKATLHQLSTALDEACRLAPTAAAASGAAAESQDPLTQAAEIARDAQSVIIVPGYGMALAHAASEAVGLGRTLEKLGKDVRYAVHPVAGRMPGHMHVLLAEAEVDYDKLYEMKDINPRFPETDLVLIVGACDVVNPAAVEKEGTPISGMPILRADQARHVVVLNLDEKPGYSGVPNTLYDQPQTILLFGDAKATLHQLSTALDEACSAREGA